MDQETAFACLTNGGTLVLLDMPIGTEFGIDCYQCATGDKFMGVKMIPPGVHLVYYATVSSDGAVGMRTSFFHHFEPKSFCVKKFDRQTEDFVQPSPEEIERLQADLTGDLDRRLGPYPFQDQYRKWLGLSQYISPVTVDRISPLNEHRLFNSVASFETKGFVPVNSARRKKLAEKAKPSKSMQSSSDASAGKDSVNAERRLPNTELRFVPLSDATLHCSSPSAVTAMQFDKSDLLVAYVNSHEDFSTSPDEALGESQFAFITFLFGYVFDAFEHWKQLIILYATSRRAILQRPDFYKNWLRVLFFQLREIPEDFFVDIVEGENFLVEVLHAFFDTCDATINDDANKAEADSEDNAVVDAELRSKARKLRIYLENKFGWDFSYVPDDEQPVIVKE